MYELSILEIDALIKNKKHVIEFFEEEKADKNCMLNFS
jgi:hypothetical protein